MGYIPAVSAPLTVRELKLRTFCLISYREAGKPQANANTFTDFMKDLTRGSICKHILFMAAPIWLGMLTQLAYQVVNLYFISQVGAVATAGVNVAGNVILIVTAFTHVLGIGTAVVVAHAVGHGNRTDANLAFNQSLMLSAVCGALIMVLLYAFVGPYLRLVAADAATIEAGTAYIHGALPGIALMCPWTVLGSALRGTGIVKHTVVINTLTVIVDAMLAPVLITGWGTGTPLGAQGAGIAESISILVGLASLSVYFHKVQHYITATPAFMRPQIREWKRILTIGFPAGMEFALTFLSTGVAYYAIRDFGPAAQAALGIGSRVVQTVLLPGMAIAIAAGPIAGQNFGARNSDRVKQTFRNTALMGAAVMIATMVLLQWQSEALVGIFKVDPSTVAITVVFLQLRSWGFVPQGLSYVCTTMFQGLGNTVPSMVSSGTRFATFAICVLWLSKQPQFRIEHVWYLWSASVTVQAILSLHFLRTEFRRKLPMQP